jgi:hypothetical protein
MADQKTLMIEGATLIFRNFAGKEGQFNDAGDRNFAVIIDPENAEKFIADGWNIKQLNPRDEDEVGSFYLPVKVNFKNRPPRVVMITSAGRTNLDEDTVESLDFVDIRTADLIVRAYEWGPINGKSGIKAYLQSLYVTIEEDELDRKYAEVPEG